MRWAQNKCSDTKYIMKTDDGIIVNVEQLVNNSKSFKSGITGILIPKRKPDRTIGDMWYIPESTYPDEYLSDHLMGSAYIMTIDIIKLLM